MVAGDGVSHYHVEWYVVLWSEELIRSLLLILMMQNSQRHSVCSSREGWPMQVLIDPEETRSRMSHGGGNGHSR